MQVFKKKSLFQSKRFLIPAAILLIAAGAAGVYGYNRWSDSRAPKDVPVRPTNSVDYGPPTKQELDETERKKQDITKDTPEDTSGNTQNNSNQTPTITPLITYAGQYGQVIEAAGYAQGVIEDNGTCTFQFSLGSQKVTRQTKGLKDAAHTNCPSVSIPRSDFPAAGKWNLVLSYESSNGKGATAPQEIEVK